MRILPVLALALPFALASPNFLVLKDQDKLTAAGGGGGGGGGDDDGRGACLRSCFKDKPECPKNMDPYKLGDCYSCCLRQRKNPEPHPPKSATRKGATLLLDIDIVDDRDEDGDEDGDEDDFNSDSESLKEPDERKFLRT
ncbi:hypothetical protein BDV19DRAFT_39797 [Aspergillus venezuelensis]